MDDDIPFPRPTTEAQAQHLRDQLQDSIASRALKNTHPDPDMERVLVALGCDGDSLHDLLVAAEAMRAEIERLRAENADLRNAINWETPCVNCGKLMDQNYAQYCEIERLRRWKAEATDVLGVWQRLGDDVVAVMDSADTLGRRIPDIVADRLAALEAEVERLRAAGDAMAHAATNDLPCREVVGAIADWQEARGV